MTAGESKDRARETFEIIPVSVSPRPKPCVCENMNESEREIMKIIRIGIQAKNTFSEMGVLVANNAKHYSSKVF